MRRAEADKQRLPLAKARANRLPLDWASLDAAASRRSSARASSATTTWRELVRYIDWTPFFQTWELKGRFPAILDDAEAGRGGAPALRGRAGDAEAASSPSAGSPQGRDRLLAGQRRRATTSRSTPARAARERLATFFTLRQQIARRDGRPNAGARRFRRARRDAARPTMSAASWSPPAWPRSASPSASSA